MTWAISRCALCDHPRSQAMKNVLDQVVFEVSSLVLSFGRSL